MTVSFDSPKNRLRPSQHGRRLPLLPILPPAAAEIFRVPPPFRRRSAPLGALAPLGGAPRRGQCPLMTVSVDSPKNRLSPDGGKFPDLDFSEAAGACHHSRCCLRGTAQTVSFDPPENRLRPSQHGRRLPPPKFSESRRRSVDDRLPREPWHPSAARRGVDSVR